MRYHIRTGREICHYDSRHNVNCQGFRNGMQCFKGEGTFLSKYYLKENGLDLRTESTQVEPCRVPCHTPTPQCTLSCAAVVVEHCTTKPNTYRCKNAFSFLTYVPGFPKRILPCQLNPSVWTCCRKTMPGQWQVYTPSCNPALFCTLLDSSVRRCCVLHAVLTRNKFINYSSFTRK